MKFSASQFTPTEWDSQEDKAKFANTFVAFVLSGFDRKKFTKKFYQRLSNTKGHIAEYDQNGFYSVWFATADKQERFINHWLEYPVYGDPKFTYSDVERVLEKWVIDNRAKLLAAISKRQQEELAEELKKAKQFEDRKATLANKTEEFKVVAKTGRTNSFGHYGYVLINRSGMAYETHMIPSNGEWRTGQSVTVQLDANGNPNFRYCECTRRLDKDAPQELIDSLFSTSVVASGATGAGVLCESV